VIVFYHARIILKPERAKDSAKIAFEADLERDDLLTKIALPFIQGKQFFCGGVVVNPSRVQEARFSRTNQVSRELIPFIEARRRTSGVVTFSPPEWEVIWEGEDVTRAVLNDATSQPKDGLSNANTQSDRVFVVHDMTITPLIRQNCLFAGLD
jgi:hypothetical protein